MSLITFTQRRYSHQNFKPYLWMQVPEPISCLVTINLASTTPSHWMSITINHFCCRKHDEFRQNYPIGRAGRPWYSCFAHFLCASQLVISKLVYKLRKYTVMYQTPRCILVVVKLLCWEACLDVREWKDGTHTSIYVAVFLNARTCISYL